ncbi:VC0807 family protein [Dictyobacter formicarum]|uniref:DUF3159 domain-containing protein n=1 Tax=Dictyobacter formicarum TaxID=2778368 RepID=A0ABQ3VTR8_9CHLR|nr:VC0807 family protein [Dictyobacter formicarum]GHO88773.1 hypothetical protein KSZ_67790 [Dictyobacter formicarum]
MADGRSTLRRLNFSSVIPSNILQTIAIDVVFPYMAYQLFMARLAAPLALLLVALLPLGHVLWQYNQQRRLDLIGLVALYILFWITLGALVPDASPLLLTVLHYVLPIGILGIVTLLTRWLRRPLLFYVDRYCHAHTPDHMADYIDYWQESASYRQMILRMNTGWGLGQLLFSFFVLLLFFLIPVAFSASIILVTTCLFYIVLTMWSVQQESKQAAEWDKMNSEQDPPAIGS